MTNSLSYGMSQSNSEIFRDNNSDRQSTQTLNLHNDDEPDIDGYCMPKISNVNNH